MPSSAFFSRKNSQPPHSRHKSSRVLSGSVHRLAPPQAEADRIFFSLLRTVEKNHENDILRLVPKEPIHFSMNDGQTNTAIFWSIVKDEKDKNACISEE